MSISAELPSNFKLDKNTSMIIKGLQQILLAIINDNNFKPFPEKEDLKFIIKVLLTAKYDQLARQVLLKPPPDDEDENEMLFHIFVFTANRLFTKGQIEIGMNKVIEKLRSYPSSSSPVTSSSGDSTD